MVTAVQAWSQATRYRFDDLSLDSGLRRVARHGRVLRLGKLTYEMLVALVEAAPNVVTHDRLIEWVWGGRTATPETVAQRVKLLRRALDDDASQPRYIEVVRGQGYRLIPPVERESETLAPAAVELPFESSRARSDTPQPVGAEARVSSSGRPSRRKRQWVSASVLLIAAGLGALTWWFVRDRQTTAPPPVSGAPAQAAINSIAVLPFVDLSERQDQQYFSDGITEEILDRLANSQGQLRVIARTSSFSFRDRPVDIPQIAATLKVSHVLEGSVRRSGDQVRVTAQLINGSDGSHIWSQTYDRTVDDLFNVQDDIATAVAYSLHGALAGERGEGRSPSSVQAYEDYLHGKFLSNRRAPGDHELAVRYLESAVARDPGYVRAWSALSGAYTQMWWELGLDPADWTPKQGEAARKAVELDPELIEARSRLAHYYFQTSNTQQWIEQLRVIATLDPKNPRLAAFLRDPTAWHSDPEDAIESYRAALENDPYSTMGHLNLGLMLFAAGRLEEALTAFRKMVELNPAVGWDRAIEISRVLVAQERYEQAYASIMRLPPEARDYGFALLYQAPGMVQQADAALARLQARSGDRMHSIRVAEALCMRGRHDEALATLRRARDALERDMSILSRIWYFQLEMIISPFLAPLHPDRRWQALIAKPEGDSAEEIIERLWPASRTAAEPRWSEGVKPTQ